MTTERPCAASMPPMRALPYPFRWTSTTLAPSSRASGWEPSLLPLSATMLSAEYPPLAMASRAMAMQAGSVPASLRHGITIETSTAAGVSRTGDEGRGATFIGLEVSGGARGQLEVGPKINDQCHVELYAGFSGRPPVTRRGVGPRRAPLSPPRNEMTPTDRLSRAGTCLAACSCSLERFPRGRRQH